MTISTRSRGHTRAGNVSFRDDTYSLTRGGSLWELAPMLAALSDPSAFTLFRDDFTDIDITATTGKYVVSKDGTPTIGPTDAANGVLSIASGATDNDSSSVATVKKGWLFAANKPLWFEAAFSLTEANTDDANLFVGLASVVDKTIMQNNGAGVIANFDGAGWYKVDGDLHLRFGTSKATAQVLNATAGVFVSGTSYRVGFIFDPAGGTTGSITPYLNGTALTAHAITLSGLTAMALVLNAKAGGSNAETLLVDWVQILAVR